MSAKANIANPKKTLSMCSFKLAMSKQRLCVHIPRFMQVCTFLLRLQSTFVFTFAALWVARLWLALAGSGACWLGLGLAGFAWRWLGLAGWLWFGLSGFGWLGKERHLDLLQTYLFKSGSPSTMSPKANIANPRNTLSTFYLHLQIHHNMFLTFAPDCSLYVFIPNWPLDCNP